MVSLPRILLFLLFFTACSHLEQTAKTDDISAGFSFGGTQRDPANDSYFDSARLKEQADMPFSSKFRFVTENIPDLSKANISSVFKKCMELPNFNSVYEASKSNAQKFVEALVVTHSTTVANAEKILESGEIKSLDKLVREGLLDPIKKKHSATNCYADGFIGEQDAVFLAIRSPEKIEDSRFGSVTFQFNKRAALEKGYFSPFAYSVGIESASSSKDLSKLDQIISFNSKLSDVYRPFIFSGWQDFQELAHLSVAHHDWVRLNITDRFREAFAELPRTADKSYPDVNFTTYGKQITSLLKALNQPVEILNSNTHQIDTFLEWWTEGSFDPRRKNSSFFKYLNAYRGFPVGAGPISPMWTDAFEFWELKIPESVSLQLVEKIIVRKWEWKGNPHPEPGRPVWVKQPIAVELLESGIFKLGKKIGKVVISKAYEDYIEYTFR
jgi:hypothetical protein